MAMPNGTINPSQDYVSALISDAARRWPTLTKAKSDAVAVHKLLHENLRQFTSGDVDVVVFGSLARQEWTSGSDVDWTLLIDGQANSAHRLAAREVERTLEGLSYNGVSLKQPGAEGIFGIMAFSHEIVHHIGGQADSNRNTTQRILLLTEAVALRDLGDELGACERMIRQVLHRYLVNDSNFHSKSDQESRIPRFLLNDIVRYWRTMCVDFAYKDWEQDGKKWALRNVKLRMSRKLLFFSSLLTIFSCFHNESLRRDDADKDKYLIKIQKHLLAYVHSTPLNIISWTLGQVGLNKQCCDLLDRYERFLRLLDSKDIRDHLGKLNQDVYEDKQFLECRAISHELQLTLKQVCFELPSPLRDFTSEYGVF
jgi:predicted nucleotidyltransferase